jgi:hypothetical protein
MVYLVLAQQASLSAEKQHDRVTREKATVTEGSRNLYQYVTWVSDLYYYDSIKD